jgi:hypothetical protein
VGEQGTPGHREGTVRQPGVVPEGDAATVTHKHTGDGAVERYQLAEHRLVCGSGTHHQVDGVVAD